MRDIDKVQRQVHYLTAQIYDSEDVTGNNNTWQYNRAPEGYVFELHSAIFATTRVNEERYGVMAIFDGHEYTHWNIYPGVQSNEVLGRAEFDTNQFIEVVALNSWECKEYTLGIRSTSSTKAFKTIIIVWYYLRKMSHLETLYYAVIQPRWKRFKKAFGTTLSRFEE